MALYDHRVFKHDDKWWVAEVHSASGGGPGTVTKFRHDAVLFTCISNDEAKSLRVTIPAGYLNQITHASIVHLLEKAQPMESRFDMSPYNIPSTDQPHQLAALQDDEGLNWIIRQSIGIRAGPTGTERVPAVDVVCLDDTALKKQVLLKDEFTYVDAKKSSAVDIDTALIVAVKNSFRKL